MLEPDQFAAVLNAKCRVKAELKESIDADKVLAAALLMRLWMKLEHAALTLGYWRGNSA